MKTLFTILCIIFTLISLYATGFGSITLKNGTILNGTITHYEPGKYVTIVLETGKEKIINWDSIDSVELNNESLNRSEPLQQTDEKIIIDTKDQLSLTYDATLPSDVLRVYWQQQGGTRKYTDTNFLYVNVSMDYETLTEGTSSKMTAQGHGLGMSGSTNWLFFSPPNYSTKKYYSFASKIGLGYNLNLNYMSFESESDLGFGDGSSIEMETTLVTTNVEAGPTLGVNVGLGAFPLSQKWFGAVLGLNWRPALRLVTTSSNIKTKFLNSDTEMSDMQTDAQFILGALEYSLDIGSIKALTDKFAPRSSFRLSFMYFPPVGDSKTKMWMIGMGYGEYK